MSVFDTFYWRKGFSLLEAAIVLGVIGLVIGGIWAAAASLNWQFGKQEFFNGMSRLITGAESTLTQQIPCDTSVLNLGGCCAAAPLQGQLWPQEWTADRLRRLSGRSYLTVLGTVRCDASEARYLELEWTELDSNFCDELVSRFGLYDRPGMQKGCDGAGQTQRLSIEIPRRN